MRAVDGGDGAARERAREREQRREERPEGEGNEQGVEAAPRRRREASRWPGDAGRQPGGVAPARVPCAVPPLPTGRGRG